MLCVAAAGRRRGVSRALVKACLDQAQADGMREVLLSSLPKMTAAHALYGQFGFVRAPELDHSAKAGRTAVGLPARPVRQKTVTI